MTAIAKKLRLKDDHPTMVKVYKLMELADDLGISFEFCGQGGVVVHDYDCKLPTLILEDIEPDHWFQEFPFATEFKITCDNPAYLAQAKIEEEKRLKVQREALAEAQRKQEEARLEKEKQEALRIERAEREELARLQTKYKEA